MIILSSTHTTEHVRRTHPRHFDDLVGIVARDRGRRSSSSDYYFFTLHGRQLLVRVAAHQRFQLLRRLDGSVVETIPLTGALEEWADFPRVVAGASGDLWIGGDSSLAHRVGGVATKVALPQTDGFLGPWAAAPDGSLWIAQSPGLRLLHITASRRAAGGGADHGGGPRRRARTGRCGSRTATSSPTSGPRASAGRATTRQPTVRLPDVRHGRVTLAALRRRHGLRVTSSEPGSMIGAVTVAGVDVGPAGRRPARHHPALLAEAAAPHRAGGRIEVRYLQVWDANGNGGGPRWPTCG